MNDYGYWYEMDEMKVSEITRRELINANFPKIKIYSEDNFSKFPKRDKNLKLLKLDTFRIPSVELHSKTSNSKNKSSAHYWDPIVYGDYNLQDEMLKYGVLQRIDGKGTVK